MSDVPEEWQPSGITLASHTANSDSLPATPLQSPQTELTGGTQEASDSGAVPMDVQDASPGPVSAPESSPDAVSPRSRSEKCSEVHAQPVAPSTPTSTEHTNGNESHTASEAHAISAESSTNLSPGPSYTLEASQDPALLRSRLDKYREVHARLKAAYSAANAENAQLKKQLVAMRTVADFMGKSVLGRKLRDGAPAFCIVAKLAVPKLDSVAQWLCLKALPLDARIEGAAAEVSEAADMEWVQEEVVRAAYPELESAISGTEAWVSPLDVSTLKARLTDVQEEFRRFRIRAEAVLRQKESEIQQERERALGAESARILAPTSRSLALSPPQSAISMADLGDLQAQVKELAARNEKLLKWQEKAREREADMKDAIAQLTNECEQLREGSAKPSVQTQGHPVLTSPSAGHASLAGQIEALKEERDKLQSDFTAYRKRTINIVKEKEEQLTKLTSEVTEYRKQIRALTDAGAQQRGESIDPPPRDGPAATPVGSGDCAVAPPKCSPRQHPLPSPSQWEYLRNILTRYLSAPDERVRAQLEPAIMTVIGLRPLEVAGIKRAQEKAIVPPDASSGLMGSIFSNASSWLGLGQGPPEPAGTR